MKKRLLILYHSHTGHTAALARQCRLGALEERSQVVTRVRRAAQSNLDDLLWCDAVLFGTPENFGSLSGCLKDFFERTYYPAQPYQLNRAYGLFVSAGNDGSGAVRETERILRGYPMKAVLKPLIVRGDLSLDDRQAARLLGQTMAAGLAFGIY